MNDDVNDEPQEIQVVTFGLNVADELYDFRPTAGKYDELEAEEAAPKESAPPADGEGQGDPEPKETKETKTEEAAKPASKTTSLEQGSTDSTPPGKSKQPA